ncbi:MULTISPECIES: hypothetical protein [unclassified Bacillus (in: firmicutes)]|uniref:hypothetical protein n=1 Tax=unclassified Bacillus (in: firmicutes) TaxID=185979 RepID=UPI000BF55B2E|nr:MULTISPECIES: hypothetical protein [unclassified Bacillus (in: firmicutes)]PEU16814.1 hypothetical protein CN524_03550 [Bacillus sp. AFS019443]PFW61529.1 hypothetical protein COL20_16945 [Bacillus sp. AFS075034]
MNYVEKKNTITNNTDFYILVGNCVDVISNHKTLDDATTALNGINVSDSKWASIWILEPGETRSGTYTQTIYEEQDGVSFDL